MLVNEPDSFSFFKKNGRLMEEEPKINKELNDFLKEIHNKKYLN